MIAILLVLLLSSAPGVPPGVGFGSPADSLAGGRGSPAVSAHRPAPRSPDSVRVVVVLPEVRVDRERALSDARRRLPTAFVTDLQPGRSGRALETLSEALAEVAGVRVQQYGGLGAFSTVSLRGAPSGQVAIYLDGAPLTSAARGLVNLADLPATAIERVEIYRGISPLEFGSATPGGAINLVTVSSAALRRAALARGSFGTWEGRGTMGGRLGRLSLIAHAGYQGSDGDFRYADDNGTPFNADDDEVSARVNNRFDAATALVALNLPVRPGLMLSAREDLFHKSQGLPGLGAVPAYHTRLSLLRSLTHLDLEQRPGRRLPGVRVQLSLERERSRFRDLQAELGLGAHDTDDRSGGERGAVTLTSPSLPLGAALVASGSARLERSRSSDAGDRVADPPASRRRTLGASAGLQVRPFGDLLTLHAARRWDRLADHLRSNGAGGMAQAADVVREVGSPQAGLRLAPGLGLELRANWADASRAPDFLELFGNQGSVLGNPALQPERSGLWDAGGGWSGALGAFARGSVEWAHYESRSRDLILYVRNSPSSVRAQNISRARIRGEELSARLSAGAGVSLSAALTWQTTLDEGSVPAWRGRRLPQRPERQVSARADALRGRMRASVDVQFIGEDFLDRANRMRAAARTLTGASLSATVTRGVRFTLEGKNLGNARASDVAGFPLPGRSVFASCQVDLAGPGAGAP